MLMSCAVSISYHAQGCFACRQVDMALSYGLGSVLCIVSLVLQGNPIPIACGALAIAAHSPNSTVEEHLLLVHLPALVGFLSVAIW